MSKALYTGKLHFDRYFEHNTLGLIWDLKLLKRVAKEDESGFNNRLNAENERLCEHVNHQPGWLATLGFVPSQVEALSDEWVSIFRQKSYLFVYDSSISIKINDELPSYNKVEADFVKDRSGQVYTWLSGDNMNYRFRIVSKQEVEEYGKTLQTSTSTNNGSTETSGSNVTDGFIHIKCPHCGKTIF